MTSAELRLLGRQLHQLRKHAVLVRHQHYRDMPDDAAQKLHLAVAALHDAEHEIAAVRLGQALVAEEVEETE